jgi:hypothetical protein
MTDGGQSLKQKLWFFRKEILKWENQIFYKETKTLK